MKVKFSEMFTTGRDAEAWFLKDVVYLCGGQCFDSGSVTWNILTCNAAMSSNNMRTLNVFPVRVRLIALIWREMQCKNKARIQCRAVVCCTAPHPPPPQPPPSPAASYCTPGVGGGRHWHQGTHVHTLSTDTLTPPSAQPRRHTGSM